MSVCAKSAPLKSSGSPRTSAPRPHPTNADNTASGSLRIARSNAFAGPVGLRRQYGQDRNFIDQPWQFIFLDLESAQRRPRIQ